MGCATSKQQPVCRNCKAPCSPMSRSYSVHVHHPPERDGDTYHVVALTSSTLGSLKLDPLNHQNRRRSEASAATILNADDKIHAGDQNRDFSMGVIEAKTWSRLIDEKISKVAPRTPIRTPPGEPETIDAFELMAGLEDATPIPYHRHIRSFSFNFASNSNSNSILPPSDQIKSNLIENCRSLWLETAENESSSNSNSIISDFDPDVITAFRKSLEVLPPAEPFQFNSLINEKQQTMAGNNEPLDVTDGNKSNGYKFPNKDKLVVYFTSLRGVRKTYEDCCYVRDILKGLGFRLDERDVSMHSGFKEELKELLGDIGFSGGGLPRVFLGKKLIGGVEEIRRMHEAGQLEKVFEGCELVNSSGGGICEACGDIRFMPCETCWGSCKIYKDDEDEESEFGFQRCRNCNENGLIRCPVCCD